MKTTTFTASFTFPTESIIAFAEWLGYRKMLGDTENPESALDFIQRLAKEHNEKFVTQWADTLARMELEKQIAPIKKQIDEAITKPVKEAIQVTYEEN